MIYFLSFTPIFISHNSRIIPSSIPLPPSLSFPSSPPLFFYLSLRLISPFALTSPSVLFLSFLISSNPGRCIFLGLRTLDLLYTWLLLECFIHHWLAADIVWGKIDGTIRELLSVLGRGSYQGREKHRVKDGQGMRAEHWKRKNWREKIWKE